MVVGEIIQYVGRKGVYGFLGRYSVRGLDRFFSLWVLRDMEVVFLKKFNRVGKRFKPCVFEKGFGVARKKKRLRCGEGKKARSNFLFFGDSQGPSLD